MLFEWEEGQLCCLGWSGNTGFYLTKLVEIGICTYGVECFEVLGAVLVDVLWLVAEDLAGEVVQQVGEVLGDWVLLDEFAYHLFLI